jgi:hypothetical protein
MKDRITAIGCFLFASVIQVYAAQLTGVFTYSSTGFPLGEIPSDPVELQSPAYFIFDTDKQEIKVFNYIDTSLSHIFDRHRVFQVSDRNTSGTISTLSQLFDFSITAWNGDKVLDLGDGMVYNRYYSVDGNGNWWASEGGGIWRPGVSGFGQILSYSEYTPELPEEGTKISQREEFIDISYKASTGFAQTLHVSYDMSEWVEVSDAGSNPLEGNAYISSLFKSIQKTDLDPQAFFRVTVSPLTFEE